MANTHRDLVQRNIHLSEEVIPRLQRIKKTQKILSQKQLDIIQTK